MYIVRNRFSLQFLKHHLCPLVAAGRQAKQGVHIGGELRDAAVISSDA